MTSCLELPAVVGVKGILGRANEDATVIMDGKAGELVLNPPAEIITEYHEK